MRARSYWTYSAGLAVVWAVVAVGRPAIAPTVLTVFGGFAIGWVSTTIARHVYPPPRRWTSSSGVGRGGG